MYREIPFDSLSAKTSATGELDECFQLAIEYK